MDPNVATRARYTEGMLDKHEAWFRLKGMDEAIPQAEGTLSPAIGAFRHAANLTCNLHT